VESIRSERQAIHNALTHSLTHSNFPCIIEYRAEWGDKHTHAHTHDGADYTSRHPICNNDQQVHQNIQSTHTLTHDTWPRPLPPPPPPPPPPQLQNLSLARQPHPAQIQSRSLGCVFSWRAAFCLRALRHIVINKQARSFFYVKCSFMLHLKRTKIKASTGAVCMCV